MKAMKQKGYELNDKDNKHCPKCETIKPRDKEHFHKHSSKPDGLNAWCKECIKEKNRSKKLRDYKKKWKAENPDKMATYAEYNREYIKAYRVENPDYDKEYYQKNKERLDAYQVQYRKERKERDPSYKLRLNMSSTISMAIKRYDGTKGGASCLEHLPYDMHQLVEHLENQFDDKMNWDNYGSYWHIDHIHPQSLLPYQSMQDENFLKCWCLENLQPLEALENIRKSNKVLK